MAELNVRPDAWPTMRDHPRSKWLDAGAWIALLLAIPAMLPLLAPGYFVKAHDARNTLFFLTEFHRAFSAGAWWPVWAPDIAVGFGYPLWLVYAPLAYFLAEGFHLLGLGIAAALKATWALGFVLGALGAYRLARRWWGPTAGLIASLAFTYAPYHLVQIYVRAALAEFMALAWLPWALLALLTLWDDPRPRRAAQAALAVAAVLMLNTTSTMIFTPLIGGFLLVLLATARRKLAAARRSLAWLIIALTLGGLLASIFLLPLVFERSNIVEAQWIHATYDYALNFVYLHQFFDPAWGFGYSRPGPQDGMSFQLGLLILPLATLGSIAAVVGRRGTLPNRGVALFLGGATVVALFTMTAASGAVWATLPLIKLAQFPWRMLAITTFTLAMLAGAGAGWLEQRNNTPANRSPYPALLAVCLVLVSFPYTRPQLFPLRPQDEGPRAVIDFELQYQDMRGMTRWSERIPTDADSPLIAQYLAGEPLRRVALATGEGAILAQEAGALSTWARVRADGPVRLRFYIYYFPGWYATIDGQPAAIAPDRPNGLIGLDLPPGEHEVTLRFTATPIRRVATAISLAAMLGVIVLAALKR